MLIDNRGEFFEVSAENVTEMRKERVRNMTQDDVLPILASVRIVDGFPVTNVDVVTHPAKV